MVFRCSAFAGVVPVKLVKGSLSSSFITLTPESKAEQTNRTDNGDAALHNKRSEDLTDIKLSSSD